MMTLGRSRWENIKGTVLRFCITSVCSVYNVYVKLFDPEGYAKFLIPYFLPFFEHPTKHHIFVNTVSVVDANVNSILHCVLDIYDEGCTADCQIFVEGLSLCAFLNDKV